MEGNPEVEPIKDCPVEDDVAKTAGAEDVSDTELDQLLDESLGEFGKHVPVVSPLGTLPTPQSPAAAAPKTAPPAAGQPHPPSLESAEEMEQMFGAEFAAEAEAQLGEAMQMLSDENPELWRQFETFTKSMGGLTDMGPFPPAFGAASKGESSVDAGSASATPGEGGATPGEGGASKQAPQTSETSEGGSGGGSLDQKLDDTIKRMQENATHLGTDASQQLGGLEGMLNQLDLGSEEGEDNFMKMMQGMMSTLLSKEVLYPSLVDLCKQYPDWLTSHRDGISKEDYHRYSKQLEVMTSICREFENASGGAESSQASSNSEKILQLMQQLQQYGQPPEDMAGENMQHAGIPPGLQNLMGGPAADPQNCSVM